MADEHAGMSFADVLGGFDSAAVKQSKTKKKTTKPLRKSKTNSPSPSRSTSRGRKEHKSDRSKSSRHDVTRSQDRDTNQASRRHARDDSGSKSSHKSRESRKRHIRDVSDAVDVPLPSKEVLVMTVCASCIFGSSR